jgi:STE24 endopeptidase
MILGGFAVSVMGFWLCDLVLRLWVLGRGGAIDYSALPIYTVAMILLLLAVFRLVLEPLQNAVSRHFERQADRYALDRTSRAEAYISAFCKLAQQNKDDPDPPRWEVLLFYSHPPIRKRLQMAERWRKSDPGSEHARTTETPPGPRR